MTGNLPDLLFFQNFRKDGPKDRGLQILPVTEPPEYRELTGQKEKLAQLKKMEKPAQQRRVL